MYSFKFLIRLFSIFAVIAILAVSYYIKTSKKYNNNQAVHVYFRWNQLSNTTNVPNMAKILAAKNLKFSQAELLASDESVLSVLPITKSATYNEELNYYEVTIPKLNKGIYYLRALEKKSQAYNVDQFSHVNIISSTLSFFKSQRCGHAQSQKNITCHKEQITVVDAESNKALDIDLSGGWHDAGDYLRFVFTTSYTTLALLTAAEELNATDPLRAQILEEAEWGLLWLKKMTLNSVGEFYQIGDVSDHSSWRLPEADTRSDYKVKVYRMDKLSGANLLGRTIACMALYSKLIANVDKEKSSQWKNSSLELLKSAQIKTHAQKSTDNFYNESLWQDDMALAYLSLFELTNEPIYLRKAEQHIQSQGDMWHYSYDQLHALVYYKWAKSNPKNNTIAIKKLEKALKMYQEWQNKNLFSQAVDSLFWGSQTQILGAGITALIYQKISRQNTFQNIAVAQWDYTLGNNPWGVSFISGIGNTWLQNPHHQTSQIRNTELIGYWGPGAVSQKNWQTQNIKLSRQDKWAVFQSKNAVLYDDYQDYVTNEPTISVAATGILFTALMNSLYDSK